MNSSCMTVAAVNFHPIAGDVQRNLKRIMEYTEAAVSRGAQTVLFPELALTGHGGKKNDEMQKCLAETIPGTSSCAVADLSSRLGIHVVFGMPVRKADKIYNSLVICGPQGILDIYDKLHLTAADSGWAAEGERLPPLFDTSCGKMMAVTGFDLIYYPEVCRYGKAKGAKMLIGASALEDNGMGEAWQKILERNVGLNTLPVALSSLAGEYGGRHFAGGTQILMPAEPIEQIYVSAGYPFDHPSGFKPGLYMTVIDMTADILMPHYPYFEHNYKVGTPDWRPDVYEKMTADILALQQKERIES